MDRRLTLPVFGGAPDEYDRAYMDDVARKLNQLITALRSPGEGRQSRLVITNMTSGDYGLEPGTLFENNGVVYVSIEYRPSPSGVSANGLVGTVTVTTV